MPTIVNRRPLPDHFGRMPLGPGAFEERVEALQQKWGLRVSSGYRTPTDNERVGGDPDSAHMLHLAVDLVGESLQDDESRRQIIEDALRLGLWILWEGDHLHLQGIPTSRFLFSEPQV